METKIEMYHRHNDEQQRFQLACDQILHLNGKLDDLGRRYMAAKDTNNKHFRYSLRSRMLVVEGMLTAYCNYAKLKRLEILQLRQKLAGVNPGGDELYQSDDDEDVNNDSGHAVYQYLRKVKVPCITGIKRTGCTTGKLPVFDLFPVLFAVILSWVICAILTATDVFPENPDGWGYNARTDRNSYVLKNSRWFRLPYPGQWGRPTVSAASIFGLLPGVIASIIESVGDYYTCAKLSGAPPPPTHAMNRGCGMEGIGCILAGAIGTGNGMTSYSPNIGVIGLTKVGSLRVVQYAGIIMIFLGCLGKFGALFATIPDPVIGGMFMVSFGMTTSVGLFNLQYVDLNSSRNMFVIGVSLFFGFSMPVWMSANPTVINTGIDVIDQIFTVLLSTSMFVGGFVGLVLDNTIPGTDEERGINIWRKLTPDKENKTEQCNMHIYDFPIVQKYFNGNRLFEYIPFCPTFLRDRGEVKEVKENHTRSCLKPRTKNRTQKPEGLLESNEMYDFKSI